MMTNGDDHISSNERRLWRLHGVICQRWGIYTWFTHQMVDIPRQCPEMIKWFVPSSAPNLKELVAWIEKELITFKTEGHPASPKDDCPAWPATQTYVMVASDLEPYMDTDEMREFMDRNLEGFLAMLTGEMSGKKH